MTSQTEDGVLVLADISGFTAFVTATELEHGPPIIAELLEAVMRHLSPPLEIQEVEGDAVFAWGRDATLVPRATLLDAFDEAYAAFRSRQRAPDRGDARVARLDAAQPGLAAHVERYDHLGEVRCFVRDVQTPVAA